MNPQTIAILEPYAIIASLIGGVAVVFSALSKLATIAQKIKLKTDNSKNARGTYLWIALIAWAMNLFFILRGDEITRWFIFSCALNIALLELIVIGYIVKQWIAYISNAIDKN